MSSATLQKFGYPDSVIEEGPLWTVLLRPGQVTLGSLVLICREPATAFGELSPRAFSQLGELIGRVERSLKEAFGYDKINYLMLMMVDPEVHFHVIPRYSRERQLDGVLFYDPSWPGPPDLGRTNDVDDAVRQAIKRHLLSSWK